MLELVGFVGSVGSSRLTVSINFCKYTMSCSYFQFMSSASGQTTFGPKFFFSIHYHVETRPFRFVFQIRVRRNHVATINCHNQHHDTPHNKNDTSFSWKRGGNSVGHTGLRARNLLHHSLGWGKNRVWNVVVFLPVLVVAVSSLSLVSLVSKAHDGEMNEPMKKGTNWSQKGRTKGRQG